MNATTDELRDWSAAMRAADPLADDAIAAVAGPWGDAALQRLAQANRAIATWTTNASLEDWRCTLPGIAPDIAAPLQAFVEAARSLPDWARDGDIACAEQVFMDYGPLSCTLLFCASLPECYVMPDLADVLHAAGQLEQHTEYRIRRTAAMVFPVMLRGGLTTPAGSGVAQVLKVRLIHATIRHLILHGHPVQASGCIAPEACTRPAAGLHEALKSHGWDLDRQGMPCSQFELAYTLLTFHYVFLRGMRQLGIRLSLAQEHAYLHAWNVVGHVLGIETDLMPQTMADARTMFSQMQALAPGQVDGPDPRPLLGRALMDAMAQSIALPVLRDLPVPLTRWLVGQRSAAAIGANREVGLLTRAVFFTGLWSVRAVDALVRVVRPQFSITRMVTRVLGYHLLTRFLLDQTRPLALPSELRVPMQATVAGWGHDRHAPGWINRLEDRITMPGGWGPQA